MFSKNARYLLLTVVALLIVGIIMVLSSSWPYAVQKGLSPYHFFKNQVIYATIGLFFMFVFSKIDHRIYQKYALWIFVGALTLTAFVYTPLGVEINSARRWLNVIAFKMMPSDILKFASICMCAAYISKYEIKIRTIRYGLLPMVVLMIAAGIPVYKQPDLSTALVIMGTIFLMFVIGGIDIAHILSTAASGIAFVVIAILNDKIGYSRVDRMKAFLHPLEHVNNESWQLVQSLCAVATGGFLGLGLGRSRQKYMYLSEAHNDFIFAIVSEELGFVGSFTIICMYVALAVFGLRIAFQIRSSFSRYMVIGSVTLITMQAFMNICVVVGLIPPTGITLPFISYGGSSLIVMLTTIGVVLNIDHYHRKEII